MRFGDPARASMRAAAAAGLLAAALLTTSACSTHEPPKTLQPSMVNTHGKWTIQRSANADHFFIAVDFLNPLEGWAFGDEVMRTDNGGASWHRQTLPKLPSGDPFALYDGTAADEDHAWVVGTAGDGHTAKTSEVILATDDGGSHWRVQRCKEWAPMLTGVAFADAKVGWAIAPGWPNVVLSTVDGGITWKRLPFPANASADSIYCVDRQHVWALSGPRRIYSSSDGGHSWRMSPTGLPDKFAATGGSWFDGAMQFLDAHHGWMTGGQDGSILSTQDGGLHWRLVARLSAPKGSHNLMLRAIHFADSRHGWVLGQSQTKSDTIGLFAQTDDGGRSWEPVDLPEAAADETWALLALDSVSPNRAWAVGVGLILTRQGEASP